MRGVFLSYRRSDTAGHVGRLHDHLAARFGAERVFMDVGDIAAGEDFTRALERELARADVVVVAIGDGWLTASQDGGRRLDDPRDHHRREIEAAIAQGKRLVPVLVEGARMPAEGELPPPLRPLARCQAVELRDSRWGDDVEALSRALGGARPAGKSSEPPRAPRLAMLALAATVAAVSAYGVFLRPREDAAGALSPTAREPARAPAVTAAPTARPTLPGAWKRENGSRWTITQDGDTLRIEEIHHESKQPWLAGRGELEGDALRVSLAHLYGGDLRLVGTLAVAPDGRTLSGRMRREPSGQEETVVLVRE
jgi:hypothetical protein